MALLSINNLSLAVRNKVILDKLSLELEPERIHALIGANGTGKSSLAYVIMGCVGYAASTGEIRFQGDLINRLSIHERAKLGITLCWQEPARFEGLTVRDYLLLGRASSDAVDCLSRVGLKAELFLDRAVDKTLSGGERKRIELASILAMQPKLAILDEPASGIDMLSIHEIGEVIQTLNKQGATVLLITHQQEIVKIAQRASLLCGGRIVATGEPEIIAEKFRSRGCVVCNGIQCRDE